MRKTLNKFINCNFIKVVMAFITYYALCNLQIINNFSVLSWLIVLLLVIINLKTNFSTKYKKESIILAILFAFITIYGKNAYELMYSKSLNVIGEFLSISNIWNIIGTFNFILVMLINVFEKTCKYGLKSKNSIIKKPIYIFIISFIIIIACWIPYFLAFYPGTLTPDSFDELSTVLRHFSHPSDHHPLLHIIFMSVPYNIGYKIFGNMYSAIGTVTISQMVIMASIFSYFILFLYKRKVSDYILLIILLFYALLPVNALYSIVMWKDVIFSGLVLLLSIELVKICENKNIKFKNLVGFLIISILCIFFRNNAIYMYILLIISTLVIFRKYYKPFLLVFLIVFGSYIIIKGPVYNILKVSKSSSTEYIAIPLQQIGRMAYKGVDFTSKEEKLINKIMDTNEIAESYDPVVVDSIKFNKKYNGNAFEKNKLKYFKLWLSLVLKHPGVALESYAISTLGYWYPGVDREGIVTEMYNQNKYSLEIKSKVSEKFKNKLINFSSNQTSILNIEWSIGLYFWIILIFSIVSFKKKGVIGLYPFVPVLGLWLTLMVATPVYAEYRYIYGAVVSLPLLMIVPYLKYKK